MNSGIVCNVPDDAGSGLGVRDITYFSVATTCTILKFQPVAENGGIQLESACAV